MMRTGDFTFTEKIVSALGTAKEPFGVDDALLLIVITLGAAIYVRIEYGAGRLIPRMFDCFKKPKNTNKEPPQIQ